MKQAHPSITQGRDGKWYWHIVASNGKIIADGGEGYCSKSNAKRALRNLIKLIRSL